jgi:rRNA maturation endonuclease Nob1
MFTYQLECEGCFSSCEIIFEGDVPERIHCPHCGEQQESDDRFGELDFDE